MINNCDAIKVFFRRLKKYTVAYYSYFLSVHLKKFKTILVSKDLRGRDCICPRYFNFCQICFFFSPKNGILWFLITYKFFSLNNTLKMLICFSYYSLYKFLFLKSIAASNKWVDHAFFFGFMYSLNYRDTMTPRRHFIISQ